MTMAMPEAFDPLIDFDGLWTTDLAAGLTAVEMAAMPGGTAWPPG